MAKETNKFSFGKEVNDLLIKMRRVPDGAKVKEVFLWELVLNATVALLDVREESFVDAKKHGAEPKLFIQIVPNKSNGTLSIIDSGIGMTGDDLVDELCTLDPERLRKYMRTIDKYLKPDADGDLSCIYSEDWEFGLGFFSTYMVADKVVITTKQIGDKPLYVWKFEADEDSDLNSVTYFTVDEDTSGGDTHERGTKVTLHLKKNHFEYLNVCKLQELVDKYDKYTCLYPISILDKPIGEKQIIVDDDKENVDDDKENKLKEDDKLKDEFEGLRQLYVKHLKDKVNNIVISSRVYEITSNLSCDRETFYINPRHPIVKDLKEKAKANPDDEEVKDKILLQFESALINILLYDWRYGTTFYDQVKQLSLTYYDKDA